MLIRLILQNSYLLEFLEMDPGVRRSDLLVDHPGLLHPFVTAGQRYRLSIGLVVAELGERRELGLERGFMVITPVGRHDTTAYLDLVLIDTRLQI